MGNILQSLYKNQKSTPFALEDVKNYVKASTVTARKGTKCVDGRYLPNQGHGMLARPGADCGYVMALEAVNRNKNLGLTPTECFNYVFKAVQKLNKKFYLHTDEHTDPSPHIHNGLIGCGHLAKAGRKGLSWEYDVRSGDIKEIVHYARSLCEVSSDIEMINLAGKHEEKGVLLVHGDKYSVLTDNPKRHQMYFVYDVDRDRIFMKQLVKTMNIPGVTFEDMIREANLQLEATLQNLAVGLPLYEVTFVGSRPKVQYLKHIEQKSFISRLHVPFASPFNFPPKK
jgi:hypothetical protein